MSEVHRPAKVFGLDGDGVTVVCSCGAEVEGVDRGDAMVRHDADVCRSATVVGLAGAREALAEAKARNRFVPTPDAPGLADVEPDRSDRLAWGRWRWSMTDEEAWGEER